MCDTFFDEIKVYIYRHLYKGEETCMYETVTF